MNTITNSPDGWHVKVFDKAVAYYDNPTDCIHQSLLGFCAYGPPEGVLPHVRKGLRCLADKLDPVKEFGSAEIANFFFWWADSRGFIEVRDTFPGDLNESGRQLLADLTELAAMAADGQVITYVAREGDEPHERNTGASETSG